MQRASTVARMAIHLAESERPTPHVIGLMKATFGLAALVVALLTGCGLIPLGCSGASCESMVVFHLAADLRNEVAYDVEACLDDECSTATIEVPTEDAEGVRFTGIEEGAILLLTDTDEIHLSLPDSDYSGAHRVRLEVRTPDGDVVVAIDQRTDFERDYPNGPNCEPVCWRAEVTV